MIDLEFQKAEIKQRMDGSMEVALLISKNQKAAVMQLDQELQKETLMAARIGQKKKKRSLDANAYAWVLINKIAVELSKESITTPEDVYRELIPGVGGNNVIVPVKEEALEAWIHNWENEPKTKLGWEVKVLGPSKIPGYINTVNYYGSSTYDNKQMARLIDLLVDTCKQLGIETWSPEELEILKGAWKAPNKPIEEGKH